jgi:hypothetical protein
MHTLMQRPHNPFFEKNNTILVNNCKQDNSTLRDLHNDVLKLMVMCACVSFRSGLGFLIVL